MLRKTRLIFRAQKFYSTELAKLVGNSLSQRASIQQASILLKQAYEQFSNSQLQVSRQMYDEALKTLESEIPEKNTALHAIAYNNAAETLRYLINQGNSDENTNYLYQFKDVLKLYKLLQVITQSI